MEFIDLHQVALTLETTGTLMIAWAALAVHHKVRVESKIDQQVKKIIHKEEIIVVIGAAIIILSYILQIGFIN